MILSQRTYVIKYLAILMAVFTSFVSTAQDDIFPCNGDLIITLYGNTGGNTNAFNIELNGSAALFGSLATYSIEVNSTGFNSQDGYIYGVSTFGDIIRLKADGTYDNLGMPNDPRIPFSISSAAGDFDADGVYWFHERLQDLFIGIDIASFTVVDVLELEWHSSTGNSGKFIQSIDDFVFDPLDKTVMYTYQRDWQNTADVNGTRGHLLRVNVDKGSPDYGFIFSEGRLASSEITHLGAMFFDSQGQMFGYGDNNPNSPTNQNRLVRIDRDPARANLVATGPGASANDGCSCPFSMYVTKRTPDSYNVCEGTPIEVTYEIGNTSSTSSDGTTFIDTFPPGFVIQDIIFDKVFGIVKPGTGIGTNRLVIEGINLVNEEVEFTVLVTPSLVSGTYKIYAELTDLPVRFGNSIFSDDPETFASNDPTIFIVDYELFQNEFEISEDVIMCEGEIANFTASVPLAGTTITWNTGEQGPFASTAEAGMVIAVAELGACIDTDTALVEIVPYPEVDLGVDITPCDADVTVLEIPFTPGLDYSWNTGDNNNAIVINESGQYILEVDDRGCKTSDTINVDIVLENYELVLDDKSLCEGEGFSLEVDNPWPVTFEWTLPDGSTHNNNTIDFADLQPDESGMVTIDMEYLDCKYTETFDLSVNEYPVADLDSIERHCIGDEVILSVPFDSDYTYKWSTNESTESIAVNTSGTYVVEIDNNGCLAVDSSVVDYVFEEFQTAFPDIVICEGDSIAFLAENDLPIIYDWTLPDGSVNNSDRIVYSPVSYEDAGQYNLVMRFNQCIFDDEFILDVNAQPELELDNEVTYDICDSLTLNINDVTPGTTIEWTPADIFSCQNCETNTAMTTSDQLIIVSVVDDIGCETVDSIFLNIEDTGLGNPVHIPNIFSPNGDNNNEFFIVQPLCYNIETFEIYDRWGNMVYVKPPEQDMIEWDGRNHIDNCTEGVYTWIAKFHFINSGERKTLSGDVTIVR